QRMAARRAIIRKLPAVETLGSTTVICTDKTGTLTRNEMTVKALWTPQGSWSLTGVGYAPEGGLTDGEQPVPEVPEPARALLVASALCIAASLRRDEADWNIVGDPTEAALVVAAEKLGLKADEQRKRHPRLDAVPFESEHKYMATLHDGLDGGPVLLLKGAPEVVLGRCGADEGERARILAEVERLAGQGMRVLAVARRTLPQGTRKVSKELVEEGGFELLGLHGMIDPPRPEAIDAIAACHRAGVAVKMITGDHKLTAHAIGKELGLGDAPAVTGAELAKASDDELRAVVQKTNVFARVAPEHKLRLVRALQADGHVVAMTGDGVNDAPALKQANIGVAMGITGTAVARESAEIVLTDDNFASIEAAVEEGRRVYDNLIKSFAFVLPTNLGLALILIVAVAFFPFELVDGERVPLLPLLPRQILWINLVASVALSLPLAFEIAEPEVMDRPPRR
ncbi:MAG: cation-translocating P-type ATPase, partial [Myxococcales bacterium]